jgi:hypothetical protein
MRLYVRARRQLAAVVKLDTAEATVIQFSAGEPFQRVQRTGGHPVDRIPAMQLRYAACAAHRAADILAEMKCVPARNQLFVPAIPAFVNRKIIEAFEKGPVNVFEPTTSAMAALPHRRLYTAIPNHVQ